MLICSHWTMFSLGWDCLLSRAIALNWKDNFPTCPISPLFSGYLLINHATLFVLAALLPRKWRSLGDICFSCYRWFTNPTTVNAFYSASTNQIREYSVSRLLVNLVQNEGNFSMTVIKGRAFLILPPKVIRCVGEGSLSPYPYAQFSSLSSP